MRIKDILYVEVLAIRSSRIFQDYAKICARCRTERQKYKEKDQKYPGQGFSELFTGFGTYNENIDVLLILDAHGGGRKWFKKKPPLEETACELEKYYCTEPLQTFHQMKIRGILSELDDTGASWFITDLVKCFVYNNPLNREIAEKNCFNSYLKKQICYLKPRSVVMFGNRVINIIEKGILIPNRINIQIGKLSKIHGKKSMGEIKIDNTIFSSEFIYSIFPSQWTADIWIKYNAKEKLLNSIKY